MPQKSCQSGAKLYSQYALNDLPGEDLHKCRTWQENTKNYQIHESTLLVILKVACIANFFQRAFHVKLGARAKNWEEGGREGRRRNTYIRQTTGFRSSFVACPQLVDKHQRRWPSMVYLKKHTHWKATINKWFIIIS